jgi:5-formyltetrahydrofolate cyclo-ligase
MQPLKQLRNSLRARRQSLSSQERESKSQRIAANLSRFLPFQRARNISFYFATEEEVDTTPAIQMARELGKNTYLPVVNNTALRKSPLLFQEYSPGVTRMRPNKFGIPEPQHVIGQCLRGAQLDLVCVPLVAFNPDLERLGMGGGFYDRTFAASELGWQKVYLVGLAFDCQEADFNARTHDVRMNAIITESGIRS